MELDFALLAEGATTGDRAQVHLIGGGFDTVETPKVPAFIPVAMVARFSAGLEDFGGTHSIRFEIVRPDGTETVLGNIEDAQFPPPVNESRRSHLSAVAKAMLKLPDFGIYEVKIFADEQLVKKLPIHVTEIATAPESDN